MGKRKSRKKAGKRKRRRRKMFREWGGISFSVRNSSKNSPCRLIDIGINGFIGALKRFLPLCMPGIIGGVGMGGTIANGGRNDRATATAAAALFCGNGNIVPLL